MRFTLAAVLLASMLTGDVVRADVKVPSIFSSHMVLQRNQANRVWGWAEKGEKVKVSIGKTLVETSAKDDGSWSVELPSMKAGGPHKIVIEGQNRVVLEDVLVGEVWVCSGQSNMGYSVNASNDPDLERLAANFPNIRLISVPQVGTQEPQKDFKGAWQRCSPETVGDFSGVGYFFGRQLHQSLDVPVGLIDNAWGGSACEAWIRRDIFEADKRYAPLLKYWDDFAKTYNHKAALEKYNLQLEKWKVQTAAARKAGQPLPRRPRPPRNRLVGQHRPANLYNGVLKPTIGYGIKGAIWYQGESNASRAHQYRHLFPLMISHWRKEWGQGDFPFYFVQLADFRDEVAEPGDSDWAELREAQTMTLQALPNVGQAVITDLGEAHDIHPKDKQNVAKRLARWALAKDYGIDIVYRSPEYASHKVLADGKVEVTFDHVGSGLDTHDIRTPRGFSIAGEDQKFVWANAEIVGKNKVVVSAASVKNPVAVRYAWSDNPVCNLQNREHLPATPFRTDQWKGITEGVVTP